MSPFDQAWSAVKAYPLLWPKELDNDPDLGAFFNPNAASAMTAVHPRRGAASFVRLPNLTRESRRRSDSSEERDERLAHDYMEADVHEDTHVAMDRIGETSDNPIHNEIPATIAQALQFQRRPRHLNPHDKTWELLDEGVSPTKVAVDLGMGLAPHHQQVKGGYK